jgi:phosphoglycolate phosphatase-like HAD superfamily hydrolase
MRHVVWDWNGTLLADQELVVDALNLCLTDAGLPPTDLATYQRLYTRPVRRFYERLFDREITDAEWHRLDEVFHDGYAAALERVRLADDALDALEAIQGKGRTQSLLSMYRHEQLVPLVTRLGVHDHFVRIDGLRGPGGGNKAPYLEAHLERVVHAAGDDPSRVLIIGDALDDAAAAAHVGTRCVLYDGGSHPREELERSGVPVADSLVHALDLAGL